MTSIRETSYQEELIKKEVQVVLLIKQLTPAPKFYYLMLPVGKVIEFKRTIVQGTVNFKAWGNILYQGDGEPSEIIKTEMQEKYGCATDGMALTLPMPIY